MESNLFWSTRLCHSLRALGHEAVTTEVPEGADVAIVNLDDPQLMGLVGRLTEMGVYVIGHAGHKEKELHRLGAEAGCNRLVSNGELTYKLNKLLEEI